MIRKIGLTGGIASGKSRVAGMLATMLDCVHIDADEVCRKLLAPQAEGWQEFTKVFGLEYLADDGSINRTLLRRDLFAVEDFRQKVNGIIHPLVKRTIIAAMDQVVATGGNSRVLVEVPLLYEVQWENLFDTVIVVYADYETCLTRLMERDGVERRTASKELESQLPLSEKVTRADHVIDNSGMLSETNKQVQHLTDLLKNNGKEEEKA